MNDPHLAVIPPASRKSNYEQCIKNKLIEIAEFIIDQDIDVICGTGDWLHFKGDEKNPYSLVNWLAEWFYKIEVPFVTAIGNHDCKLLTEFGNDPLKLALDAGGIDYRVDSGEVFDSRNYPRFEMEKQVKIIVVNYDKGDTAASIWDVAHRGDLGYGRNDYIRILVVHGPIVRPDMVDQYPQAFLEKMVNANDLKDVADYVFYGDIHDDHNLYRIGGTLFCNYGSLSRNSSKELARDREVSVAYLDTVVGNVQRVSLENVIPTVDAFKSDEIAEEKEKNVSMEQFIESIGKTGFAVLTPDDLKEKIRIAEQLNSTEKTIAIDAIDSVT